MRKYRLTLEIEEDGEINRKIIESSKSYRDCRVDVAKVGELLAMAAQWNDLRCEVAASSCGGETLIAMISCLANHYNYAPWLRVPGRKAIARKNQGVDYPTHRVAGVED